MRAGWDTDSKTEKLSSYTRCFLQLPARTGAKGRHGNRSTQRPPGLGKKWFSLGEVAGRGIGVRLPVWQ